MAITISLPAPPNPLFKPPRPLLAAPPRPSRSEPPATEAPPHLLYLLSSTLNLILAYLLTSPAPLVLHRDASTPANYRTNLTTSILLVNRRLYHTSLPILYGANTFTASSAATSYDFDAHLLAIPGRCRAMIKSVELTIDWGHRLWAKMPLVAARLLELRGLKSLKLHISVDGEVENAEAVGSGVTGRERGVRQGLAAEAMLKAEKKVLRELVEGLRGLRVFELNGFVDGEFARELEEWIRGGRKG
ncbi:MAG: hypothetical protein LQ344_004395 [Seirophora lacunosa]|nr:MAG: hypothetical protein LQ344_004395 [Seirophora lacunosa]